MKENEKIIIIGELESNIVKMEMYIMEIGKIILKVVTEKI